MSSERKDVEVNLSMASLMPVAGFRSSAWSAEMAKKVGCDGIKILPGIWTVREFNRKGYLPIESSFIRSVHDSWERDRSAEIEYNLKADTNIDAQAMITSWLLRRVFPPEKKTEPFLQKLERYYDIPVIFHWPADTVYYHRPYLEINPHIELPPDELIGWVEQDLDHRGIVLDVSQRKFGEYLIKQGIPENQSPEIIDKLLPYIKEVHFQVKSVEEIELRGKGLEQIKRERPDIPIVVEAKSLKSVFEAAIGKTPEFHRQIVDFIRKA